MTITTIISFTAPAPASGAIDKLTQALKSSNDTPPFAIGTPVQKPSTIQITSEWPLSTYPTASAISASPAFHAFTETISSVVSSPLQIILAQLTDFASTDGTSQPGASQPGASQPDTSPLVEFVKTDFPATLATPAFRTRIETDFAAFERIYRQRGAPYEVGERGLRTGWAESVASAKHEDAQEDGKERVVSFFAIRGWEEMQAFELAVQSEAFKQGIPILMGWAAPFELWHVERKVVSEGS